MTLTPAQTRELETQYYDSNSERCAIGIRAAISDGGLAIGEWDIEKMQNALWLFRWWAAEYESILQRVLDEAKESQ